MCTVANQVSHHSAELIWLAKERENKKITYTNIYIYNEQEVKWGTKEFNTSEPQMSLRKG